MISSSRPDQSDKGPLQRVVEAAAISPEDARALVAKYSRRYGGTDHASRQRAAQAIVRRYSTLAMAGGAATALPSIIPGLGTAVAALGGGLTDLAVTLKLQVDMCLCLVELFNDELPAEDKRALGFLLALAGSAEQFATRGGVKAVEEVTRRIVLMYLRGATLQTIKALFGRIGITFTQKAAAKLLPFGFGVGLSAAANYGLTRVVGAIAIRFFKEVPTKVGS